MPVSILSLNTKEIDSMKKTLQEIVTRQEFKVTFISAYGRNLFGKMVDKNVFEN